MTGHFKSNAEKSIAMEIVDAKRKKAYGLARDIRKIRGQKYVLVTSLSASANKTA